MITRRVKDVLFAIGAADKYQHAPGRLHLQKIIYLADVLSPIWRAISKPSEFRPWHNGPYDAAIQNSVDSLVFRGFVRATMPTFRTLTSVECQYSPTDVGRETILALGRIQYLGVDFDLFDAICGELNRLGWHRTKELVYAEPTYESAKLSKLSENLPTSSLDDNLTKSFLSNLAESLRGPSGEPVSRQNLVKLFFAVLSENAEIQRLELRD